MKSTEPKDEQDESKDEQDEQDEPKDEQDEPKDEQDEPKDEQDEPKDELENTMHRWCRMYATVDDFMDELYTKEQVIGLQEICMGNKKLVALQLWKSFSVQTKKNMFVDI
jgi:hypothetical protein